MCYKAVMGCTEQTVTHEFLKRTRETVWRRTSAEISSHRAKAWNVLHETKVTKYIYSTVLGPYTVQPVRWVVSADVATEQHSSHSFTGCTYCTRDSDDNGKWTNTEAGGELEDGLERGERWNSQYEVSCCL